jgi:hypothetical protein
MRLHMRLHSVKFPDAEWLALQAEAAKLGVSASYLLRRTAALYCAQQAKAVRGK